MDSAKDSVWLRHDLHVALFILALFAGGVLVHRHLSEPRLTSFDQMGLHFQRPSGWLPGQSPPRAQAPLAATLSSHGFGKEPRTAPDWSRVYQSAENVNQRIEVRIADKPSYPNLRGALAIERLSKYGEFYWSDESATYTPRANPSQWIRTEFRYAYKRNKTSSPIIVQAIEYAILKGEHLFAVTVHGEVDNVDDLDALLAPTLTVQTKSGAAE